MNCYTTSTKRVNDVHEGFIKFSEYHKVKYNFSIKIFDQEIENLNTEYFNNKHFIYVKEIYVTYFNLNSCNERKTIKYITSLSGTYVYT